MRAVVQLVSSARVQVDGRTCGRIGNGLVVLLGVHRRDGHRDASYLAEKVVNLRIFPDARGQMNLSLRETGGEMLVVSQFTLFGDCRKGRRPSWSEAAPPESARELYADFIREVAARGITVAEGEFQAMMEVSLVNRGPVTLLLDSDLNP